MRALQRSTWVELKLFLREPLTVIFTLALPLLFLFVLGGVFGNQPDAGYYRGAGPLDFYVPGYIALVWAAVGLLALPVHLARYREDGVLRRLRASSAPRWVVLGSQFAVSFVVSARRRRAGHPRRRPHLPHPRPPLGPRLRPGLAAVRRAVRLPRPAVRQHRLLPRRARRRPRRVLRHDDARRHRPTPRGPHRGHARRPLRTPPHLHRPAHARPLARTALEPHRHRRRPRLHRRRPRRDPDAVPLGVALPPTNPGPHRARHRHSVVAVRVAHERPGAGQGIGQGRGQGLWQGRSSAWVHEQPTRQTSRLSTGPRCPPFPAQGVDSHRPRADAVRIRSCW